MRRLILLLMLCVLPLQFALAATVDARAHAGNGHAHESVAFAHDGLAATVSDAANADADESSPRLHGECGACHLCHCLAILGSRADVRRAIDLASIDPSRRDQHHRNAATERPERPNWSILV